MSYFAAAVARDDDGWSASDVSLFDTADLEDVADHMRDLSTSADVALLFAEFDDVYLVILRLDQGEDLRVFGSDTAFANESRFGAMLLGDLTPPVTTAEFDPVEANRAETNRAEVPAQDAEAEPSAGARSATLPDAEPVGDPDLLADLGVPSSRLLELCAQEGMLPADITAELCQAIGCGDEVEELREA